MNLLACVINVISHYAAYSLFPYATFVEATSLNITTAGSGQDAAREKYEKRGWRMKSSAAKFELLASLSDFRVGFRWVGDNRTWTIPLDPPLHSGALTCSPDLLPLHSFGLEYDSNYDPKLKYQFIRNHAWKNVYAVADSAQAEDAWETVKARFVLTSYECTFSFKTKATGM